MKLGGELELRGVDTKTSTIVARRLFLNLVWEMKSEVVNDLMRLFNIESVPADLPVKPNPIDYSAKLFLLHTKSQHYYLIDLTELGYESDVRQTPILAYFDYIFRNQTKFDELLIESEKKWKDCSPAPHQKLITQSALGELIPNWKTLQSRNDAVWLCAELYQWAEKWNLKDDWCLDFALDCLKDFKIELIDECHFDDDYLESNHYCSSLWELNQFCHHGVSWERNLSSFRSENIENYLFTDKIKGYPKLNYVWELKTKNGKQKIFSVDEYYNPLVMFPEFFRRKVEEQFWSKFFDFFSRRQYIFVGNNKLLTDELNKFQKSVDEYIKKAEKAMKPFADKTAIKKSGDKHFRWLVEYQILERSFNSLAKEKGVDRKAITDGIKDVSQLINLTLRDSSEGGRKQGAKDITERQERRSRSK